MDPITLLVISSPRYPITQFLDRVPQPVRILASDDLEYLKQHAPEADVILNSFHDAGSLKAILPLAHRVKWIHALSAGVEGLLFPELVEHVAPLTNGQGVYGPGLAEFGIAAMLFFAKDFRRLIHQQQAGRWEQFDVDFLRGQVLGVIGYGGIGQETARLARALGMRVVATRRRSASTPGDSILERAFPIEQLHELLGMSDFVFLATPLTAQTRGMIGEAEFNAMKPSAVFINVSRGRVVDEAGLIAALTSRRIRGAALDVYVQEPLPAGHPFYGMDNVLLSPHSADHTVGWTELAVKLFLSNFERFRAGLPLENVVDKRAGY
ncbi:MAG TPA: D-2-hydroxyacid dehydrogenase [Bryobacteraceae bacterium]|nr:D-2-hydroxyacid dehydrogenase [Bryobacteraceae bacterium]